MAVLRKLRQLYTDNRELTQLQNNIKEVLEGFRLCSLLEGNLVSVTLSTTPTAVPHNLNRQPQGWFVVDITVAATIHRTSWDKSFLTLESSAANTTVVLWVF